MKEMKIWNLFKRKREPEKKTKKRKNNNSNKKLKEAFEKIRLEQNKQNQLIKLNSERIEKLEILPNQFLELKKQFSEFIMSSVSSPTTSPTLHQNQNEVSELTLKNLTPHTKKAFEIIVMLLNEYSEEWLPVSELISDLYPTKEPKKVRNALSNTLKPLYDNDLIKKKREGNFVFIKLTKKGFQIIKKELSDKKLKKLEKYV